MRFILELVPSGGKLGNKKIGPITNIVILIMIIMITDRYNCSGDYRYACTLVGQGLHHISLKSPRARLYHFKLPLENDCLSRYE